MDITRWSIPKSVQFSSVHFSLSVMSDSLWPHGLKHARPPCPSSTLGVHSNSCPLSWWCHPTISAVFIFKRKEANLHHWFKFAFHLHFSTSPHSRTSQKHPFPQQLFTSPSPTFYLLTLQTYRFSVRVISTTVLSNLVANSLLFLPVASDKLKHSWPEILGMLWVSKHSGLYFQGKR